MKSVSINGSERKEICKKATKALRNAGQVPCVLYGGKTPVHFSAEVNEFRKIVFTPDVYLIDLTIDGNECKAIMQDIQFHPVSDEILHVDFLQIFEDKAVKINVPVKLEGFAKGIQQGGKLKLNLRTLRVKALPQDLPDTISIDVTELGLGQSFRVGDVDSEGLELLNSKSTPVATVMITRAARAAMNAAKGK
ncbi:50S ribosomal protein L25/general stress protein Ctc [Halosquirtibacter laminarini]|uniref:50S ribosomal protein L25/general stress protein Ctc n=1 Tax=Halosquirtibacter laminarini TaxID=3374600 RepID=A0AC61NMT0_9BACT|nr:50S ribosomal protein L25/general stress protein Ctc [Prolixibacteraceae bacterium]